MARRRRRRERKPVDKGSILALCLGGISLVLFLIVFSRVWRGNSAGRLSAAAGVLAAVLSLFSMIRGLMEVRKNDYSTWSRMTGLFIPLASLVCWGAVYILGMIRG